jgi:hypothetical protein
MLATEHISIGKQFLDVGDIEYAVGDIFQAS